MDDIFSYIIIGGGFSGLFLQKIMKENGIDSLILEENQMGGQLNLYLNKNIYDIPGIVKITGQELINLLQPSSNIKTFCSVELIENIDQYKQLTIKDNGIIKYLKCKNLIVACGKGSVKPVKFNHPGLDTIENMGKVFYSLNSNNYENKKIAVLGGGDSAIDAVEFFQNQGSEVCLIHRRELTAMAGKINNLSEIKFYLNNGIENIKWNGSEIFIEIKNIKTQIIENLHVDYIFVFYGIVTDDSHLTKLFNEKKILVDRATMEPVNNYLIDYAIGDSAIYPNKRFLIHNYMAEAYRLLDGIKKNNNN